MALDHDKILLAIRNKLLGVSGLPDPTHRAWVNIEFDPPSPNEAWIQERYNPVSEIYASSGLLEGRGFAEYTIRWPIGDGPGDAYDLSKAIRDHFDVPGSCSYDGVVVAIDRVEQGREGVDEEIWFSIPVIITWRCYAAT